MHTISEGIERKFEDVIEIDEWEIATDSGWQPVSSIMKTVPYQKWYLTLEDETWIECADDHIVFLSSGEEIFVKELTPGQEILTENGPVKVRSNYTNDEYENMYDIAVDSEDHRYYANGVLHHNTTVAAGYLLWYAMFKADSTILIVANKGDQAMEIMQRIRFAYEEVPDHIRAGSTTYNKGSLEFDNGSRIIARATSATAARGMSVTLMYCLGGENTVKVRNKKTGLIEDISLEDLSTKLNKNIG